MSDKEMSEPLDGFEKVSRYWDEKLCKTIVKLKPGEIYLTKNTNEIVTTTLGSCVAVCLYDAMTNVCGMNHFLLPFKGDENQCSDASRYGNWAMESLINGAINLGGFKYSMEFKVFGGSKVLDKSSHINVPEKNVDFILNYFKKENLRLITSDLRGIEVRVISYHTDSRVTELRKLKSKDNASVIFGENNYLKDMYNKSIGNDVQLF